MTFWDCWAARLQPPAGTYEGPGRAARPEATAAPQHSRGKRLSRPALGTRLARPETRGMQWWIYGIEAGIDYAGWVESQLTGPCWACSYVVALPLGGYCEREMGLRGRRCGRRIRRDHGLVGYAGTSWGRWHHFGGARRDTNRSYRRRHLTGRSRSWSNATVSRRRVILLLHHAARTHVWTVRLLCGCQYDRTCGSALLARLGACRVAGVLRVQCSWEPECA